MNCVTDLVAAIGTSFSQPEIAGEVTNSNSCCSHSIGQAYAVHAKVYYTPVSVESRLLDWRKKASKSDKGGRGDTKVVYKTVDSEDEDEEDLEDHLLGVHQHDAENRTPKSDDYTIL